MLDSRFSPQVTQNEDNGQAIGFCWKKSCATLSKSSDTVKILAAKPLRDALMACMRHGSVMTQWTYVNGGSIITETDQNTLDWCNWLTSNVDANIALAFAVLMGRLHYWR